MYPWPPLSLPRVHLRLLDGEVIHAAQVRRVPPPGDIIMGDDSKLYVSLSLVPGLVMLPGVMMHDALADQIPVLRHILW